MLNHDLKLFPVGFRESGFYSIVGKKSIFFILLVDDEEGKEPFLFMFD